MSHPDLSAETVGKSEFGKATGFIFRPEKLNMQFEIELNHQAITLAKENNRNAVSAVGKRHVERVAGSDLYRLIPAVTNSRVPATRSDVVA